MTGVAVSDSYRTVHELPAELVLFVTLEAQISTLPLERVPVLALVRIVASDAIPVRNRAMQVIVEHDVAAVLMAGKTELSLVGKKAKLMIFALHPGVADGAEPRTHRAMNKSLGAHVSMALSRHTTVTLGHLSLDGNNKCDKCNKCDQR